MNCYKSHIMTIDEAAVMCGIEVGLKKLYPLDKVSYDKSSRSPLFQTTRDIIVKQWIISSELATKPL